MDIGTPFSLPDVVFGIAFSLLLLYIILLATGRSPDRRVIITAFLIKLGACFTYCIYVVFLTSGADSLYYQRAGIDYAAAMRDSFAAGDVTFPFTHSFTSIGQDATINFVNLSGLIHVFTFDSFLGASIVLAMLGLVGQFLLYKTFVSYYPDQTWRRWWQIGILYFPSLTFWSAGLLKDVLGILGLGCALWGVRNLLVRIQPRYVLLAAIGIYLLLLFRPPVAAVLFISIVAWVLISYGQAPPDGTGRDMWRARRLKIQATVVGASIVGIFVLGFIAPRYSIAQLPQTIAKDNAIYQNIGGTQQGVVTGATALVHSASWGALIQAWPNAMLVSLFRPFPWEAASIATLGAAFENLLLLLLSARAAFYFITRPELRARVIRSPLFVTGVTFLTLFAFGIGESNPNLGTISRYRIPMIPFLVATFIILEYRLRQIREEERAELEEPDLNPWERDRLQAPVGTR